MYWLHFNNAFALRYEQSTTHHLLHKPGGFSWLIIKTFCAKSVKQIMEVSNENCIVGFIERIWNENRFDLISDFLHGEFRDNSLSSKMFQNKSALIIFITSIGKIFRHKTVINDLASENEMVVIQMTIEFEYIDISELSDFDQINLQIEGYRFFRLVDNKIIEHWEVIAND